MGSVDFVTACARQGSIRPESERARERERERAKRERARARESERERERERENMRNQHLHRKLLFAWEINDFVTACARHGSIRPENTPETRDSIVRRMCVFILFFYFFVRPEDIPETRGSIVGRFFIYFILFYFKYSL